MLHTYNEVRDIPVWHIHGEARKGRSIVVGHYWYGSLLSKYKNVLDERKNSYQKSAETGEFRVTCWLDALIMGDVYVLGFGYDISEVDLWWLLNRKNSEKSPKKGTLYYYSNEDTESFNEKEELLKVCGAEVIRCSELVMPSNLSDNKYAKYNDAAIADIGIKIKTNRIEMLQQLD